MAGIPAANDTSIPRLAACARALIAHQEVADAVAFLDRMRKLDPADPAVTEIEARLAKARGDGATAVKTLEAFVGSNSDRAGQAAQLLEELGEIPAAEGMYRRFAADPRPPERILALAEFLSRRQRVGEALQLCERSWDTCKPEAVVAATLSVLMAAGSEAAHSSLGLEKRIQQTLQKNPQDAAALVALATLRQTQQRYPESIDIFRQAVDLLRAARKADAQNSSLRNNLTIALNNLAWLLAFQREPDKEALTLSNEAIELGGQVPALLDTRAVVEMALGQSAAAVDDLQNATLDRATAAMCFHLARAYLLSQNRNGAVESWQRAKSLGLKPERIDPLELPAYRELAATLDTR
jgi:tetratricopeptide (TPR) repeat protein